MLRACPTSSDNIKTKVKTYHPCIEKETLCGLSNYYRIYSEMLLSSTLMSHLCMTTDSCSYHLIWPVYICSIYLLQEVIRLDECKMIFMRIYVANLPLSSRENIIVHVYVRTHIHTHTHKHTPQNTTHIYTCFLNDCQCGVISKQCLP